MCILILPALLCVLMHAKSYVFAAACGVCALQALVMICVCTPTHWVSAQDNEKKTRSYERLHCYNANKVICRN